MVTLNSAKIETKEGGTILQLFFFRPPTKLQEGNVFNRVCLSVCPQGSHVTNDHNALDLTVEGPPSSVPLSMFKRVQLGLHCTGTPPVAKTGHLFKLVHLRTPPSAADIWWLLKHIGRQAGSTRPTGMHSSLLLRMLFILTNNVN